MNFFTTCNSGEVHLPTAKQYRKYINERDTATCHCKSPDGKRRVLIIDPDLWGDEEIPYKIGEPCKECGVVFRHSKMWIMKCSVCSPKAEGKSQ